MKKVNDPVFGDIKFENFSWNTKLNTNIWGKQFPLVVNINDLDDEGITETQRQSYSTIKENISKYIDDNVDKFIEYISTSLGESGISSSDIKSQLIPKTLVIQRDGTWGILFDTDYDIEHGIALFFKNGSAYVDIQDEFL